MILAIKTDQPQAELHLLNSTGEVVDSQIWEANRGLAFQLNSEILKLLKKHQSQFCDLTAIGIFTGTGSFTGLRIGTTVANTIAYSYKIPIVSTQTKNWLEEITKKIKQDEDQKIITPQYSSEPNITKPKTN